MRFTVAALIIGAGLSSAQSISISSACKNTLTSILASPDAQCLNPSALLQIATSSSTSSIIDPITNWLQGLCPQAPCTNSAISEVVTNITSGCSTDLASFGLQTNDASQLVPMVQQFYPAVRQIGCLKNNTAGDLCVHDLLTDVQVSVGTISITTVVNIITGFISGSTPFPQSVTCSDCVKQSFNIIQTDFSGLLPQSASSSLASTCGSTFTNGATPTDVSESASTASAGSDVLKSGAAPLLSVSFIVAVAMSILIAVSSAFAVLA